ncbi:unnamed protein product [Dictyota dichotoma]
MKIFKYFFLLNGQKYKIYSIKFIKLSEMINYLNYQNHLTIIEYNKKIFPNLLENHYLKNNDHLEIITIVGGG